MQPPLTQCAKAVFDQAQAEARSLNQEFVGTEHLVLALLKSSGCLASRVMRAQHVDREAVRSALMAVMPFADNPPVISGQLPLSPKAQRAVNQAIVMSRSLREANVSTRVLLLALMDEHGTPFVAALRETGVDVEALVKALAEKPAEPEN